MSRVLESEATESQFYVPPFKTGDRLSRTEFHTLYLDTPDNFKAELIQGVVYVSSPVSFDHCRYERRIGTMLDLYECSTPGVDGAGNATVQFDDSNEMQPDQFLRVQEGFGGQSSLSVKRYIEGSPELVFEVSRSTLNHDLTTKKTAYEKLEVLEYIVIDVNNETVHWFDLANDQQLQLDADRVLKSQSFPGLWLNITALFQNDIQAMLVTLHQGLDSPEHAAFVQLLASRRQPPSTP